MLSYEEKQIDGYTIYILKFETSSKKSLEVWLNASHGMNMCQLIVDGYEVIKWDRKRCGLEQSYGTPLLYPAPNRVEKNIFSFEENLYPMTIHGVLRFEPCQRIAIQQTEEELTVTGYFDFVKGNRLYELFPFESVLAIAYSLSKDQVKMTYTLENRDIKNLPYGLGLHPFFTKIGQTSIEVTANQVMEMDEEKIPTGHLKDVKNTHYDLTQPIDVSELNLDHVYTDRMKKPDAKVIYHELDFDIALRSSEVFSHIVVFTPQGQPFFCIENQTCSTNAHNLYGKGYEKESGLEIVKPHEVVTGEVNYYINYK